MVLDEADRRLAELMLLRGQVLEHMGSWRQAGEALERADRLSRQWRARACSLAVRRLLAIFTRRNQRLDEALSHLTEALLRGSGFGPPVAGGAALWSWLNYWTQERLRKADSILE